MWIGPKCSTANNRDDLKYNLHIILGRLTDITNTVDKLTLVMGEMGTQGLGNTWAHWAREQPQYPGRQKTGSAKAELVVGDRRLRCSPEICQGSEVGDG